VLGWSPVIRKIFGLKRKSDPRTDEVQDGGRAIVVEEGIAAFVFNSAQPHLFEGYDRVERSVLRTVGTMCRGLEVEERMMGEWEQAILSGFESLSSHS